MHCNRELPDMARVLVSACVFCIFLNFLGLVLYLFLLLFALFSPCPSICTSLSFALSLSLSFPSLCQYLYPSFLSLSRLFLFPTSLSVSISMLPLSLVSCLFPFPSFLFSRSLSLWWSAAGWTWVGGLDGFRLCCCTGWRRLVGSLGWLSEVGN